MVNVSVLILAKNEEKNITDCINSVKFADEVIVIDDFSTDNTRRIAESLGAKVVQHALNGDFAAQRNFAFKQAKSKWILYLDADERLNTELIEAIKEAVSKDEKKQYNIKRKTIAFGQEFNYGVLKPDYVARVFPHNNVHWINKVHEKPVCDLPKENLKGYIKHYTYTNWEQYFAKMDKYSTLASEQYKNNGKKCGFFKDILLRPIWAFFKVYVLQGGFLDGKLGWILSVSYSMYTMNKYLKLDYLYKSGSKL